MFLKSLICRKMGYISPGAAWEMGVGTAYVTLLTLGLVYGKLQDAQAPGSVPAASDWTSNISHTEHLPSVSLRHL